MAYSQRTLFWTFWVICIIFYILRHNHNQYCKTKRHSPEILTVLIQVVIKDNKTPQTLFILLYYDVHEVFTNVIHKYMMIMRYWNKCTINIEGISKQRYNIPQEVNIQRQKLYRFIGCVFRGRSFWVLQIAWVVQYLKPSLWEV